MGIDINGNMPITCPVTGLVMGLVTGLVIGLVTDPISGPMHDLVPGLVTVLTTQLNLPTFHVDNKQELRFVSEQHYRIWFMDLSKAKLHIEALAGFFCAYMNATPVVCFIVNLWCVLW